MNAVDTNVVVRLIVGDNPEQEAAARNLIRRNSVWISKTVVLETIWVLRKFYRLEAAVIYERLESLIGIENVHVEDASSVATAFELMSHGIDPADAMHLASTPAGSRFATFDRDLVRRAKRAGATNISGISADDGAS
jgi:predicted nucleic acid-binding protein